MNKNQQAFLELMRAGLWENDIMLPFGEVDFSVLLQQAEDQHGVGAADEGLVEFHTTASYALII